jgi:hypothetical protein
MESKINRISDLISLLRVALVDPNSRQLAIKTFQDNVWHRQSMISGGAEEQWDVLNDLALDLDYYEPNPSLRKGQFYGDAKLVLEITTALQKLDNP